MKAFLLFKNRDFRPESPPAPNWEALMRDLDLRMLLDAMSGDDELIFKVASTTLLAPKSDIETILYRQSILADCLKNEPVVRSIYELAGETLTRERRECFRPLRDFARLDSLLVESDFGNVFADARKTGENR